MNDETMNADTQPGGGQDNTGQTEEENPFENHPFTRARAERLRVHTRTVANAASENASLGAVMIIIAGVLCKLRNTDEVDIYALAEELKVDMSGELTFRLAKRDEPVALKLGLRPLTTVEKLAATLSNGFISNSRMRGRG